MIDRVLLFPYWITLKTRHLLFDKGVRKSYRTEVPSICIGNITVGGTGKTPHTEMILRHFLNDPEWNKSNIAILSRGYGRKTKGFQQVTVDGSAINYGDEPLQMKRKFPTVTVAVDSDRKEGCDILCNSDNIPKADLIILDDAFQHRSIKAHTSVVLVDFNRPISEDHLLPIGRLRDLPGRIKDADIIIVTKCNSILDAEEKTEWAESLGIQNFDADTCCGQRKKGGKKQFLFFTKICYDAPEAVFPEGDQRYLYAKSLILFSGIANDAPLRAFLNSTYSIVSHLDFPDHHKFSKGDIKSIESAAREHPTSVVMTTEKDCQRVRDCVNLSDNLKTRLFYIPIKTEFLTEEEKEIFFSTLKSYLK